MQALLSDHVSDVRSVFLFRAPGHSRIWPAHVDPCTELVEIIITGHVYFAVDGTDRLLGPGSLFWHLPGQDSIHRALPDDPYACLAIWFNCSVDRPRQLPRCCHMPDSLELEPFADECLKHFHRSGYDRTLFAQMLYRRLQWYAHVGSLSEPDPFLPSPLRSLLNFIDRNFELDLAIDRLAKQAGYSNAHLHLLFKQHLGTTPHKYVLARRLDHARHLLATSDLQVREISARVGFTDPVSFCRRFRREIGRTPSDYRRHHALHFIQH